jgi:hypothetical protein
MAWQRVRIPIPRGYSSEDKAKIGEEIVEYIRDRTESGTGVRARGDGFTTYSFPAYSKSYAQEKGQTNVDLHLSGNMLDALGVLSTDADSILIGFKNGTEENAKAEGNALGSYGGSPNPRKARSFLGLTRGELNRILKGYEKKL